MPINYLHPIDQAKPSPKPFEKLQETYKRPFSFKALGMSLAIGTGVALIVTGSLLLVNSFTHQVKTEIVSDDVQEKMPPAENPGDKQAVAGEAIIDLSKLDTDGDGLYDWQEGDFGTDSNKTDTDFDGYADKDELLFGYDPTGLGRPDMRVKIEKIAVDAPVSFPITTNEVDIQASMARGVAHYPGTAIPGAEGNIYITGHSSDYSWNEGNYKRVFRQLNDMEIGDKITIESTLNSGKVIKYTYEVYDKQVLAVNAPELWQADRDGSILTLVTSWPIDSTKERLMVRSELIEN